MLLLAGVSLPAKNDKNFATAPQGSGSDFKQEPKNSGMLRFTLIEPAMLA